MARDSAAAEKRHHRQEVKRLRDLERTAKEQSKLAAIEQARLEVDTHQGRLQVLLSIHKEQRKSWDWEALAASLPPVAPLRQRHKELRARQNQVLASAGFPSFARLGSTPAAPDGRLLDEQAFQDAMNAYPSKIVEWADRRALARRILSGDRAAFSDALAESNLVAEISELCAAPRFVVHSPRLVECAIKLSGAEIIPAESKSLTAAGKLSVKAMPKLRVHEIFQDYVCGCVLRVGREAFGILPLEVALVTASVDVLDKGTGGATEQPVLSVVIFREVLSRIDWQRVDPSDAIDSFLHRGDVKASRKSGEFVGIVPLTADDVPEPKLKNPNLAETLAQAQRMRAELVTLSADFVALAAAPLSA